MPLSVWLPCTKSTRNVLAVGVAVVALWKVAELNVPTAYTSVAHRYPTVLALS
jgi:hypothetical protein